MKYMKYLVQGAVGLVLSLVVMISRGAFASGDTVTAADRVMAISDGFTVTALLFICFGALIWISTTGFFDIFSYAFKKAAHAFVPGAYADETANYYTYVTGQKNKRKSRKERKEEMGMEETSEKSTLFIGLIFLVLCLIFWGLWYVV